MTNAEKKQQQHRKKERHRPYMHTPWAIMVAKHNEKTQLHSLKLKQSTTVSKIYSYVFNQ